VELKLAAALVAICLVGAVAGAQIAGGIFQRNAEAEAFAALQSAAEAFDAQEKSEVEKLSSTLDVVLENESLRAAFAARDRERLLAVAGPLFATMSGRDRITHWYFVEPAGTVFLRVHRPELFGDRVERVTLRRAIETRDFGAGKELGRTAFALRAIRPWLHDGQLLGYVELSEEIGQFLSAMKSRTGDDYALLVLKKHLDEQAWIRTRGTRPSTWGDRPHEVVVERTTSIPGLVDDTGDVEQVPGRGRPLGHVDREGRAYVRGLFPLMDAAERRAGALIVLHDFTRHDGALHSAVVHYAAWLLVIAVVCAALMIAALHGLVFARLARLRRALGRALQDDHLPPSRIVAPPDDDEIGRVERLFRRLIGPRGRRDGDGGGGGRARTE
jgi:hypothetical protein